MNTTAGMMVWEEGSTWYKIYGTLDVAKSTTLIIHGGPGFTHKSSEYIAELLCNSRACIVYDQIGCGLSSHYPDKDSCFWTPDLFLKELKLLISYLNLNNVDIVGTSWGGSLAMMYAIEKPIVLKSLFLISSPSNFPLMTAEVMKLRKFMSPDDQSILCECESSEDFSNPLYMGACMNFYSKHLCRVPFPPLLLEAFHDVEQDPTVYHCMWGPSEFCCVGSLKLLNFTKDLINITVPTIILSGKHDEATREVMKEVNDNISGSEWFVLEYSSHCCFFEEPAVVLEHLNRFYNK